MTPMPFFSGRPPNCGFPPAPTWSAPRCCRPFTIPGRGDRGTNATRSFIKDSAGAIQPLLASDPGSRAEAFKHYDIDALIPLLDRFEQYRFARLTLYLRQRQPDAMLNYSILVYRLTDADLARALDGPVFGPSSRIGE